MSRLLFFIILILLLIIIVISLNKREKYTLSTNKVNGICFSGGGLSAFGTHFGIITTLLRRKRLSQGRTIKISDLFRNINTVSANSGGSWFTTLLMYEREFYNTINLNTNNTQDVINLYKLAYINRLSDIRPQFKPSVMYNDFPKPIYNFLVDITNAHIYYSMNPWIEIVKKLWLVSKESLYNKRMKDTLEEFKDKDVVFHSSILTNALLDIDTNNNDETQFYSYSFKHPSESCIGPVLCRRGLRATWQRAGETCCADCCRDDSLVSTCPTQLPMIFSKSGLYPVGNYNTIQNQYITYNNNEEINPVFPNQVEEMIVGNITNQDFKNYDTSNEYVVKASAVSSDGYFVLNGICGFKKVFLAINVPQDIRSYLLRKFLMLTKIQSPVLGLNIQSDSKIYNNVCDDLKANNISANCDLSSDNKTNILDKNRENVNLKLLRLGDGGITENIGITGNIRSQQAKGCKCINLFVISRNAMSILNKICPNINVLFYDEKQPLYTDFPVSIPKVLERGSEVSYNGSYILHDDSIPRKPAILNKPQLSDRPAIFEPYKKLRSYPENGFLDSKDGLVKMNYLYFNCLKTRNSPIYGVKEGTKVNLHVVQVFTTTGLILTDESQIPDYTNLAGSVSETFNRLSDELRQNNIVSIEDLF